MKKPSRLKLLFLVIAFLLADSVFILWAFHELKDALFDFKESPPVAESGYVESYREFVIRRNCDVHVYLNGKEYRPYLFSCKDAHKLKGSYINILFSPELKSVVGMRIGQENVFGINEWKNAHFNGFLSACFFILIFTVMLISILWLLIFGNSSANPVYIKKTLAEPLSAGGGNLNYKPNFVPVIERTLNAFAAFILLVYGSYGIYTNDLYIPRMRSGGIHLHDTSALVMYSAIICACSVMISVVVDHYDKGNNEHKYKSFARFFKYLGWGLFGGALALHIVGGVYA